MTCSGSLYLGGMNPNSKEKQTNKKNKTTTTKKRNGKSQTNYNNKESVGKVYAYKVLTECYGQLMCTVRTKLA